MLRIFLTIAGILSLAAGVVGIFLPLLPTTPFILLAAFCFARSSERLHQWLLNHPKLGLMLSNWEQHRGMEAKHKKRAILLTLASFAFSIYMVPVFAVKCLLVVIAAGVLTFLGRISIVSR